MVVTLISALPAEVAARAGSWIVLVRSLVFRGAEQVRACQRGFVQYVLVLVVGPFRQRGKLRHAVVLRNLLRQVNFSRRQRVDLTQVAEEIAEHRVFLDPLV